MAISPWIFEATEADFQAQILLASQQQPVLVDFWAPWCEPCKQLTPVLEKIVSALKGRVLLAKINSDEQGQLAAMFNVRSLPTVILIRDGQPVDGFTGVQPEAAISQWLAPHLEGVEAPAEVVEEAPVVTLTPVEKLAAARAAISAEPEKSELKLALIEALLGTGESDLAATELDALPANLAVHDIAIKARAELDFARALKDAPDEATLQLRLDSKADDHLARYQFGVRRLLAGDPEAALEAFLDILQRDRQWQEDRARKSLIAAFALIDDADLVSRTRRRMAALLF
ncbi:MAG: thioredoxin [Lysobacterales bacterium CG02_land_8_20_14_3_00_62_12]|nr:MAG: thioredoxin [Xanthomonadales bacterium CG02_land_8_20_14_3_00_62_12]